MRRILSDGAFFISTLCIMTLLWWVSPKVLSALFDGNISLLAWGWSLLRPWLATNGDLMLLAGNLSDTYGYAATHIREQAASLREIEADQVSVAVRAVLGEGWVAFVQIGAAIRVLWMLWQRHLRLHPHHTYVKSHYRE